LNSVREDAVGAEWAIVDPILANEAALYSYEPGSWVPREADRVAMDVGGWHNPEEKDKVSPADDPKAASARTHSPSRTTMVATRRDHYAERFSVP
jgi:hypothetical protein